MGLMGAGLICELGWALYLRIRQASLLQTPDRNGGGMFRSLRSRALRERSRNYKAPLSEASFISPEALAHKFAPLLARPLGKACVWSYSSVWYPG